jgi:hypothetical protein
VTAVEPSGLVQTAGPASMTIPGLTKRKPERLLSYAVLLTLGLALAIGYASWQRLRPAFELPRRGPRVCQGLVAGVAGRF